MTQSIILLVQCGLKWSEAQSLGLQEEFLIFMVRKKDVSTYVADTVTSLAVDADVAVIDEAESVSLVASVVGEDRQVPGEVETIRFGE